MSDSVPLRLRVMRVAVRLMRTARRRIVGSGTLYVEDRLAEYRRYWEEAAAALGAEFVPLTRKVWEVRLDGRSTRLNNHVVALDDLVTMILAGDKPYGYRLARAVGMPVPEHRCCRLSDLGPARALLRDGACVVKPACDSASAIGVTTGVRSKRQLERAACLASLFGAEVLVERMVFGESCRLLFLDGQLLHAVRRRGVWVIGDGRSSVVDLVRAEGASVLEDETTWQTLAAAGLTPDSVPSHGEAVLARGVPAGNERTCELRTVYDEQITDTLNPQLVGQAAQLVQALGSRFTGVDVITRDHTRPLEEVGGALIELNTTPGIHHHYVGAADGQEPVGLTVLRHLLLEEPKR